MAGRGAGAEQPPGQSDAIAQSKAGPSAQSRSGSPAGTNSGSPATTKQLPITGTVHVAAVEFEGQSVFTRQRLQQEVADILGRNKGRLTLDDLEEARQKITLLYINSGYINSGAILPDQTVPPENAVIKFQIVEGRLNDVKLQGQPRLRKSYLEARAWPDRNKPLDAQALRNNLEMLRQNPNIKTINAELKPGIRPGESELELSVTENVPYQVGVQFDNNRPPSVGAERFSLVGSHSNLLGFSDALSFRWGLTKGDITDAEFAELDDVALSYSLPLNRYDTTLQISFENSDSPVTEAPFSDLNIRSRTESYSIGLRQPIYRTLGSEAALTLSIARRYNKSFLAGEPFSFSPGTENGESAVTVLRFGQEWLSRTQEQAIALRSTFSFGLDALGSTTHGQDLPDSQFFAWLGQAQYVRRLGKSEWQLIVRATAQLTPDALLPLEQFSVGGMDTVRGYRENQLVRDMAACGTIELRIPVIRRSERNILEAAIFMDGGWAKDNRIRGVPHQKDEVLTSAGLGLLWNPCRNFSATVYWGYPFKHFEQTSDNLQDYGLHFSLIATWP